MPDEGPPPAGSGGGPAQADTPAGPLSHRGIPLYAPGDPGARARARVARLAPRTLVFVPSVGLGLGLADLLDALPGECAVLCVETDPALLVRALSAGLPTDPRLAVVRTADPAEVARAARGLGVGKFRRVAEVPLSAGYRLDPGRYAEMRRALEAVVRTHWQDAATLISMGSSWVRNLLDNLAALPGSGDFSCLASSSPLVVAGAGPSLDESLPVLRRARGSYLLAAADTALPRLVEEGLEPDVVVALEAQLANIQDFVPSRGSRLVLACELSAHPATARLFPGRRYFFSSRFAELALFGRLAAAGLLPCPFPALGSVGVAAVHAALCLTTGPVFLTGLDFSFPGSRTHARGTPHHLSALRAAARTRGVEQDTVRSLSLRASIREAGKSGAPVATDLVLRSYRDGLRLETAPWAGRVRDLGRTGLDLGVPRVGEQEFLQLLGPRNPPAQPRGEPLLEVREGPVFAAEAVARFLDGEVRLLRDTAEKVSGLLARSEPAGAGDRELLEQAAAAFLHFPDREGAADPSRGFLARARVALLYYAERAARVRDAVSPPRS